MNGMNKAPHAVPTSIAPQPRREISVDPALPRRRNLPVNLINVTIWLSAKEAAKKLSVSTDTIERRAIPWRDAGQRYKVRYKYLVLDEGAEPSRRYYEPDVEAMLCEPTRLPARSRARLVPKYSQSSSGIA